MTHDRQLPRLCVPAVGMAHPKGPLSVSLIFALHILGLGPSLAQGQTLGVAVDATNLVWTTGGNSNWFGQTNDTHDGVDAARSGAITVNQSTWMQATVTGPVVLGFWWKVSSDLNCDFLSFFIDGVLQDRISGYGNWQYKSYNIATGTHTIRWTFSNDYFYAGGSNAGWVDQVQLMALADSYVWKDSPSPGQPFTNWATAAHTIQEAVNALAPGYTVWVTNGIYDTDGQVTPGYGLSNRVTITKPMTLKSINGPDVTSIQGMGPVGSNAVRCVYLGTNATLIGFTLTNGATLKTGSYFNEQSGGGVWCDVGGVVSNCTLSGNSAYYEGGGAYGGTLNSCMLYNNSATDDGGGACVASLNNCTLYGNSARYGGGSSGGTLTGCALYSNSATYGGAASGGTFNSCALSGNSAGVFGGGAYGGTFNSCTLSGNRSEDGGGVYSATMVNCALYENSATSDGGGAAYGRLQNCALLKNSAAYGGGEYNATLTNSIVYYNTAPVNPNVRAGSLNYCCTPSLPAGSGNITNAPRLISLTHIATNSPCIGKGTPVSGVDIDGEVWANPPSIGCDEPCVTSATGTLSVVIGAASTTATPECNLSFTALIGGRVTDVAWDFGDGTGMTNSLPWVYHSWMEPGQYAVVLTAWNADHPAGVSCTTVVSVIEQIYYVDGSNLNPVHPYTNWATAATNIQDAVDAPGSPGRRTVLVTNGIYETGGTAFLGASTNRVALTNVVTVRSVNGPDVTTIKGKGPWGAGAIRCAYVDTNCTLAGFTLTDGATPSMVSGAGVYCENGGTVSNCWITGNDYSGGAYGGTLNNCMVSSNLGFGASESTLNNCTVSGNSDSGVAGSTLNRCTVSGNLGGGASGSTLNSCAVVGNSGSGCGGATSCTLNNCTVVGNSSSGSAGGVIASKANNCIVYYNSAPVYANWFTNGTSSSAFSNCCTAPDPGGPANITDEPILASLSHISPESPCVGKGNSNLTSYVDIDGEGWGIVPSIGCDEPYPNMATGELAVAIVSGFSEFEPGLEVQFNALVDGRPTRSVWDFGDGTALTNLPITTHAWSSTGLYPVVFTAWNQDHPNGISFTNTVLVRQQMLFYVNVSNSTPAYPYATWETAATRIQQAIDVGKAPGRVVLVTNGEYKTGGSVVYGIMTNRVALRDGVTVRSVNGPENTTISGSLFIGIGTVRCAFVGTGCTLSGFTLKNGETRKFDGDKRVDRSGGAVWSEGGMVANCLIISNFADAWGGGAFGGSLEACVLRSNYVQSGGGGAAEATLSNCSISCNGIYSGNGRPVGGGAYKCVLDDCTLNRNSALTGGGAYDCVLRQCTISDNVAASAGGADDCSLQNCWIINNKATNGPGGGVVHGWLTNCLVSGNVSSNAGGGVFDGFVVESCTIVTNRASSYGGGIYGARAENSVIYYNTAPIGANWWTNDWRHFDYCCTTPSCAGGTGNITNEPLFKTSSYRLHPSSPCVDTGLNQEWMFVAGDMDGVQRVVNGRVDMGAYEATFWLHVWALLQGPYDTNVHAMVAGDPSNIPLTSPYPNDPRTVAAIPSNAVDWVLVELLSTNGATVISKSAFLSTQGRLLAVDGSAGITAEVSRGPYSIVLKHRNHLAAMSRYPVTFAADSSVWDFRMGAGQYAGGTNAAAELEPGVWGLIAGDADGDGAILAADAVIYTNQVGQAGYRRADFNLDGAVDDGDLALWSANQGYQSGAAAPGTSLSSGLMISPERKTVLAGASFTLTALGTSNAVNWAFVENPSGGSLSPSTITSAVYTAGPASNCVDVVQAQEGDRLGRAWVNVISSNDVAGAGRAIVMAGGKGPSDPLAPVTDYLADLAYNTLLYRGFSKDNVRYLNPETGQDVDGNGLADDVAAATTMSSAAGTFTNWAMVGTDRLFVYLVDHGGTSSGEGYFRLNGGETLTATQLDGWLDGIQAGNERELVVVLDFCESGSFLDPLKGPRRTVIAACGPNEPTYFVAGGLVSFSDAFFGAVVSGQDLAGAFSLARDAMGTYQGALADADGDGTYALADDLPPMGDVYLGPSFIAGKDIPQIGHVMGGQMLQGDTGATLWAYDIASAYPIDRVWCAVVPPDYTPDPQNPVADLPTLELSYNESTGRYEAQYNGFAELGTYKLVYYARDIWGSVSLPRPSFVWQAGYQEQMVIVAGGATNDPQWGATSNLATWAYQTALARRLGKPALRYLSAGPAQDIDGDGTNDVYAAATLSNLEESITLWPTNANRLSVYLLGSSTSNGLCRLNPSEALSATQLDGWLDAYQSTNTAALVVMDFDGCGGYVPSLAPPPGRERIVVASAKAGAPRLCALDGVCSFSRFFLSGILNGKSVGAAFALARDAIKNTSGRLRQTPQLDDSGNGVPDEKRLDGTVAASRYLGAAFATGADAPFIGAVNPDGLVVAGQPVLLWASNVLSDAGISSVWCAVTAPDYDGSGDPPRMDLPWSEANGRYEVLSTNFIVPGEYACTFFALDNTGALSAPVQSLLIAGDAYEPDGTNTLATIFPTEEVQLHSIHVSGDEDWVLFYAPTGFAFNIDATQLGTNSDLVLEVYYELPDGSLESVYGEPENGYGTGSNVTESAYLDLKTGTSGLEPGIYFVRVGSADTNLFGPGSDYALEIYEPIGGSGGVTLLSYPGPLFQYGTFVVSLSPSNAAAAGAAWRVQEQGGTWRSDNRLYSLPVPDSGDWHLEFRDAAGFTAPADQALSLQANRTVTNSAAYAPVVTYTTLLSRAVGMALDPAGGGVFSLTCPGYPGQDCAFEESTNLLQWVPVATNTVPEDGTLRSYITNNPARPRVFYRWHRIQ